MYNKNNTSLLRNLWNSMLVFVSECGMLGSVCRTDLLLRGTEVFHQNVIITEKLLEAVTKSTSHNIKM